LLSFHLLPIETLMIYIDIYIYIYTFATAP